MFAASMEKTMVDYRVQSTLPVVATVLGQIRPNNNTSDHFSKVYYNIILLKI
jgi:hypothetical protein